MHLQSYHCAVCVCNKRRNLYCIYSLTALSIRRVGFFLGVQWDLNLHPLDMILSSRAIFGSSIFREVIILVAWCIWCHRNSIIFD
ncbi:hypothetical protein HU200_048965 [Digitaria exilis]|uniref:Uncharacterized protein n=1 Tax=Digitaria exilis TaxID=1010633 RepID=A0A835AV19_9POAL|nr:hypothetical protein HU200_048965 [Digitaria exilis]